MISPATATATEVSQRQRMDALTLRLIRSGEPAAASGLCELCLSLAGSSELPAAGPLWRVAAAFFEALALALHPLDAAAKRLVAQTLLAYIAQARNGAAPPAELLAQLQQACARASPAPAGAAPLLAAVRQTMPADLPAEPLLPLAGGAAADAHDRVRLVGDLPVEIAAYNLFLNEADEASRGLLVELSEWTIESYRPVFDSTIACAQQVAEGANRVGFAGLAAFAGALAQALRHVQPYQPLVADDAALFMAAAEEIRRLLHQFAAGFLKAPQAELALALQQRRLALAPPEPQKAWAGLLVGLSSALRQGAARPDNASARAEVTRLAALLDELARQLGATECSRLTQHLCALARRLDQAPVPAEVTAEVMVEVMAELQRTLQALQAAGSAFFTTA